MRRACKLALAYAADMIRDFLGARVTRLRESASDYRVRFRWAGLAVALLAGVAFVLHQIQLVGDFRIDDAYITFSYSKNVAAGNGPVYSNGHCVEGYSNFLWMLLTAFGMFVSRSTDAYPVARFLAVAALLLTAALVYRVVRRSTGTWSGVIAAAFVLSCTDLFRAAISGLETAAFVAALTLGWHVYFAERWPRWRWGLLAFLPLALMRIDGFVPVLAVIGFEFLYALWEERFTYRRFLLWAGPMVTTWGLYFVWRWQYYGLFLNAPYYAKSMASANDPKRGIHMLEWFTKDYDVWMLSPLIVAALLFGPRAKAIALIIAIACQVAYVTQVGGDWMPFHRFFLTVVPLAAILCGWGLGGLWKFFRKWRIWFVFRLPVQLALLACVGLVAKRMYAGTVESGEEQGKINAAKETIVHVREHLLATADLMRLMLRRPGERLATDYAGVFAVETDAEIIDMWGLCNADIAVRGGIEGINPEYGKECSACYAQLLPDYFHTVVPLVRDVHSFSSTDQVINEIFQGNAIDRVIGLRTNYKVGRVVEDATGRALWFMERKRSKMPMTTRIVAPGIRVEYPFP